MTGVLLDSDVVIEVLRSRKAIVAAAPATTGLSLWSVNRKHYPMSDVRFVDARAAPEGDR